MSEIRIVFDGPPGPQSGRFVETEDAEGHGISIGEWHDRPDGLVELRIEGVDLSVAEMAGADDTNSRGTRTVRSVAQAIQGVSLKERMNRIRRGEPDPWAA